jgi:hypothetical protein
MAHKKKAHEKEMHHGKHHEHKLTHKEEVKGGKDSHMHKHKAHTKKK